VSRHTLRIVVILAALSIVGITFTQIYWVRKAFDLKENQFYRDVHSSLSSVASQIFNINKTPSPANNPVSQVSTNYFVVTVNGPIDGAVLEFLLLTEFEKRNITADFEYGIYDCIDRCMVGGNAVSPRNSSLVRASGPLPDWQGSNFDGYYFGVQFNSIETNLISQMGIWGFSSIVNLIVIFFFVYTLFVILRQRRLSEIQKDFINNMTHEFKTPIATIAISTDVLKDPNVVSSPERILNYATIIQNENNRLRQHVERVLQMARLDDDQVALKTEKIDVHAIIEDAVRNITLPLNNAGGKVDLDLQADRHIVDGDRLHLTNVFFNLIDNAIKYSKSAPEIRIKSRNVNGSVVIDVQDNGIGISAENQRKVFYKFYRVPTGNVHDVKGFGIGLNYVKLIVTAHRGRISVSSEPDKGSTFTINLPVV
jgi:two-component system, OmpR family, phosphate regulon sensor histidine kinase PhoR